MDDSDFDLLMRRASATPTAAANTVTDFSRDTQRRVRQPRWYQRRAAVVGGAVAGALVLAAGASTTIWMLQHAPYQTLEEGISRSSIAIPVDYVSASGASNHCEAFIEVRHATPDVLSQANDFAAEHDWSGLGQRAYDRAASQATSVDAINGEFGVEVGEELRAPAVRALPIVSSASAAEAGQPAWSGYSMSCQDGQR